VSALTSSRSRDGYLCQLDALDAAEAKAMEVKLTILFLTIAAVVTLSHLSRPTGVETYVVNRWRYRRLAARRARR
jgi:hypothetical protein